MGTGTIKFINYDKGYGFITLPEADKDDITEVFFHASRVIDPTFEELNKNNKVDFHIIKTAKGLQAIDVVGYEEKKKLKTNQTEEDGLNER